MDDIGSMLLAVVPVIVAALAPIITATVKALVGDSLPASAKPVINAVAGAVLAGLSGGDPVTGVVGAMLGNRVREAFKQ